MRYQTRSLLIMICIGLAGTGLTACKPKSQIPAEDLAARADDKGADKNEPPPQGGEIFPDTPLGLKLRQHILALATPAEMPAEADRRYSESLAELKKSETEAVDLLSKAYRGIDQTHYFDRWAVTKTLADLNATAAYETLAYIARAPIPAELNKDTHLFSSQEEEVMIRLRAIDGLVALAAQGNKTADADLWSLAVEPRDPNRALRTRAIKGYLRAGKDYEERAKRLKDRLQPEWHGLVTIAVTPQKEFEANVKDLAVVAQENTNQEEAEEKLPPAEAPPARKTPGGKYDEK